MDTTINQQVVIDEAIIPHAHKLRIQRSNFRLLSDISSKEATFQLVYDVLCLTPFVKAFLVIADVLEIYMQEFWAIATVHHHSIWFKMDNKKHIVEHKDTKKSNEMYYPRFTKVIIHHFMSKDPSILWINKVNWHYVRDDHMFTMIKLKTRSSSYTTVTPPTAAAGLRLSNSVKGKQPATTSKAKSLYALLEVAMTEAKQLKLATKRSLQQTHISQASGSGTNEGTGNADDDDDAQDDDAQDDDDQEDKGNDEDDQQEGSDDEQASNEEEFIHPSLSIHAEEETRDEESFDPIPKTPKHTNDEGNGEENMGMNVGREEGQDEEDEEDELYKDININLGRGVQMADVHTTQEYEDSHVTLTLVNPDGQQQSSSMDVQTSTSMAPLPVSAPTLMPSTIATITTTQQAPTPPTTAPSILLQDLPNFGSLFGFDHRLKTLEANFSEFMQTNQFAGAISSIPKIVQRYMDQRINESVKVAIQIQFDRLRDEAQAENDEFLKTFDENMQKIIKEQVKEQVKVQVFKILTKIKQTVNEQLEPEVLTRLSNSSKTSYAVAADFSEMELKKILIEKMEGNKSIHRSNEQRNLYKALVKAYESNNIILDTYGDTVTLKRRRDDDADKDKEPTTGSDQGSKRRREGKEPESASAPKEKATRSAGKSTQGSKSRQTSASESATGEEPMQTTFKMEEPIHPEFETSAYDLPIVEPSQHPEWFSQQKKPPTPDRDWNKTLPATHESIQPWISELAKHIKWIKDLVPRTMWIREPVGYDKHALWGISHWGRKRQQFYGFAINWESARDVYSKRRIIAVTKLKIVEWHNYNHLDWITVRRDDDKLYKFKEGDFKSNRTLTDVRTALDDRIKGIWMKYLPQTILRKTDKDRAAAMNQAMDKTIKTRRSMRSLERFIRGRLYEGDFRMLQRTI
nr:hypothetical protein [Tanacetum cinerariifolium]